MQLAERGLNGWLVFGVSNAKPGRLAAEYLTAARIGLDQIRHHRWNVEFGFGRVDVGDGVTLKLVL